jgi:multidrug efflux pump subunit AcrA (membrane-fusion protein)
LEHILGATGQAQDGSIVCLYRPENWCISIFWLYEGKFLARTVEVGPVRGDRVTIRSGVEPGESVVTEGSFFLRAEWLRNAPGSS